MVAKNVFSGEKNPRYKHGLTMNRKQKTLYNSWRAMKERCNNKNAVSYKYCGAKGITFCDEWNDSYNFYIWALNNGWKKGLTIDRIDPLKGYSPDNCRWITRQHNSGRKYKIPYEDLPKILERIKNGETKVSIAKDYNVAPCTIGALKRRKNINWK